MGQKASRSDHYFQSTFLGAKKQNQRHQEPIKFQYKTTKKKPERQRFEQFGFGTFSRLKSVLSGVKSAELKTQPSKPAEILKSSKDASIGKLMKNEERKRKRRLKEESWKRVPTRTNSEPNLKSARVRGRSRSKQRKHNARFGYDIENVDEFLSKATLSRPANIPVVLAFPSVLYQTRIVGYHSEVSLPLGMVVNAIFRNQNWLYVQTPHAEEGYVAYSSCLPLGIIPPAQDDNSSPCWEKSTDIFPKPSGNMTDTEKMSCKSETEDESDFCPRTRYRAAFSTCGEKSVDRLYLRAAAIAKGRGSRHTLLVINEDYKSGGEKTLKVARNEVVFLLDVSTKGWFYVKNKEGLEGYIPSAVAGHGF
ncbi:hypothetical protein D910_05053, partial [Dendroctonus ponderosae]